MITRNKIILIIFLLLLSLLVGAKTVEASDLKLNKLEIEATVNPDGSMDVVEIWDIYIYDTNTLYKTFEMDNSKFNEITYVKVTEITNNINKELTKINKYMYHVTEDCYFGLINYDGEFEIAWGVNVVGSETLKYKIEYKVTDVIAKYNDYAELYWKFIGDKFEIPADSITGIIHLPSGITQKEDILVWGHTEDLNGTVYATDVNKIEFEINNYRGNRYVEVRTLFPKDIINSTGRIMFGNILDKVLEEEQQWADAANKQREERERTEKISNAVFIIAIVIIFIIMVCKIFKYRKINLEKEKIVPTLELEYYRELPDPKATPGEATFLLKKAYQSFTNNFGQIFSANLLDLSLKKCIQIETNEEKKGSKAITIKLLNNEIYLPTEQKLIIDFCKSAVNDQYETTLHEFEKYIKSHPTETLTLIEKVHKAVKERLSEKQIFNKEKYNEYQKYAGSAIIYGLLTIFTIGIVPIGIASLINMIYCIKISKKIDILSQEGLNQVEMWKGLKKYMEEYSLLDERKVFELPLWEKFLVFATAFGIADKVLEQLKIAYPNIEEMTDISSSSYIYVMYHNSFNKNFTNAINSTIASATHSSGSGGGGGFSGGGGGGGRRRWWWREINHHHKGILNKQKESAEADSFVLRRAMLVLRNANLLL